MDADLRVSMLQENDEDEWRLTEKSVVSNVMCIIANNFEVDIFSVRKRTVVDYVAEMKGVAILEGYNHAMHERRETIKVLLHRDSEAIRRFLKGWFMSPQHRCVM